MQIKRLPELSVFFPAYNEKHNIKHALESAYKVIPEYAEKFEVIIVDDGSTDGTSQLADELKKEYKNLKVVHHDKNYGYGKALRTGFENSSYQYVFFSDSDRQFDLNEIRKLVPLMDEADIAAGIRVNRKDPFYRRLNAKAYNILVKILFGLNVRDIDCAFKLIKKKVLNDVKLKSESQFVSAEFLIKASKKGYRIKQVGVTHLPRTYGKPTGNSIKAIVNSFKELFKLRQQLK